MPSDNLSTAEKLLMLSPDEEENESGSEDLYDIKPHKKENIIPPVGIAKPELMESFMENMGDEEKILRDIKDVEDYQKENKFETAEREVKSHGLRALEGLGGSLSFLMNALSGEAYFDEKGELSNHEVPMLPSSSKLREFTKEKTGNKFEPKHEFTKNSQEALTDIGAGLPFPGGWGIKLLMPIMGQGVKATFKNQGSSEKNADIAKNVFMMGATIANIGNAPQMARNAYNEAVNMIPQTTRMATRRVENGLNTLRNQSWFRTGRTTAKGPAMDEITRIEDAIQHGSMNVHDAMQIRRDINEARRKLGSFLYEPGMDKASARQYLDRVDEVLREGLEDFGTKTNPQWLHAYERANQAYGVTRQSQVLQDYISSHALTKPIQSQTAKALFNLGGAAAISHMPGVAIGAVPILGGAKGIQILNRMYRSPLLRNYYLEVLSAATAQNAGAMNRALTKFDKEAEKLERKNQKSP